MESKFYEFLRSNGLLESFENFAACETPAAVDSSDLNPSDGSNPNLATQQCHDLEAAGNGDSHDGVMTESLHQGTVLQKGKKPHGTGSKLKSRSKLSTGSTGSHPFIQRQDETCKDPKDQLATLQCQDASVSGNKDSLKTGKTESLDQEAKKPHLIGLKVKSKPKSPSKSTKRSIKRQHESCNDPKDQLHSHECHDTGVPGSKDSLEAGKTENLHQSSAFPEPKKPNGTGSKVKSPSTQLSTQRQDKTSMDAKNQLATHEFLDAGVQGNKDSPEVERTESLHPGSALQEVKKPHTTGPKSKLKNSSKLRPSSHSSTAGHDVKHTEPKNKQFPLKIRLKPTKPTLKASASSVKHALKNPRKTSKSSDIIKGSNATDTEMKCEEPEKPGCKKLRRLSKASSEVINSEEDSSICNVTEESKSRKRTVSQSSNAEHSALPSSLSKPSISMTEALSYKNSPDFVADTETGKSFPKKARRNSSPVSDCGSGSSRTHEFEENVQQVQRERKSSAADRADSCSPGKFTVDSVDSKSSEKSLPPNCYVKLTRISPQEILKLSPKSANQASKSAAEDIFAVPSKPPMKTAKTVKSLPNKSKVAKNRVKVQKPSEDEKQPVAKESLYLSSVFHQNFQKEETDPLTKLDQETNALDFEPTEGDLDDGDAISLFPDANLFGNDEEELNCAELSFNDNDSLASYGSTDSRRLSSDMESDQQSDDENVQVEGETGILVENYCPLETEQAKTTQRASDEAVRESNVMCPTSFSPSKVVGGLTNVLDPHVNAKHRPVPQISEDQVASLDDKESEATSLKEQNKVETVTSLEDCNLERLPTSSSITEPDKLNGANSIISPSIELEPAAKATMVMSPNKNLNVQCQEKSFSNEMEVAREASTTYSLSQGMSIKCSNTTPNDGNIKKMVSIRRNTSAGSGTCPISHGAYSQTGVLPIVHPVNPLPRDTNYSRTGSNNVLSPEHSKNSKVSQEQQPSQVPRHQNVKDNVDSYRRNNLFEKSNAGPNAEIRPPLLPIPPSFQQHNVRSDETTRNLFGAGNGGTGLLPTPVGPSHSVHLSSTTWRSPPSIGSTPSTTRNVEGCYMNREASVTLVPPSQPPAMTQTVMGHQGAHPINIPRSLPTTAMMPRNLNEVPGQHNRLERNLGSDNLQFQDHQGSSNMSRKVNPDLISFQTPHGSSHQPWEANLRPNVNQDLEAVSFKDVDMRNPPPYHRSRDESVYSIYCRSHLKSGKCDNLPSCKLSHETPPVASCKDVPATKVLETVRDMMSCPFWMVEKLQETISQLGESGEKNALLKVCDRLWERDCSLQPTDFKKYSSNWLVLAKAFKDGGHSPSKAVKEILQKVIVSTTHPADKNRDVLDNILDAVRVDFLKDGRNVWDSITPLLRIKDYEIPIPVMTEVLKDAMRNRRKKQEYSEICEYLLHSPAILKPRREEEISYRQLIINFISALKQSYGLIEEADKLAFYFKWNIDKITLSAPPVFQPTQDVFLNNSNNRFRVQNWENNTSLYDYYSHQPSPKNVCQNGGPTQPVVSQGSKLKSEARHTKNMSCSTEEEDASSTEGILASTEPATNQLCNSASRDNNAGNYASLKITLKNNGRTLELAKEETCSLQPAHAQGPSSANSPLLSLPQPGAANRITSDENIPSFCQLINPLHREASNGLLHSEKTASSSQLSNPSGEESAKPFRKFVDGVRPIAEIHTMPSIPGSKGKFVAKGTMSSTLAEGKNRKNAKPAGAPPKPNILSHLSTKKYGMASKMILNMRTSDEKKIGIHVISEFFKQNSHEESVNAFKCLLTAVAGTWSSSVGDSSTKALMTSIGLLVLKHLIENAQWQSANQLYESLCLKVQDPLKFEVEMFSKASILLIRAKVLLNTNKFPEALKIVEENKFFQSPDDWAYPPVKYDEDVPLRDEVCLALLQKCISIDAFNTRVDILFRTMVMAKQSYRLDLGGAYQDVLRCLLHANRVSAATSLLVWADKNGLIPDPVTSRLLLGKISHLNKEQQKAYSPHVLLLLSLEPYKDALPQSLEGVDRVMVPMQSNWFEWEIKAIITFLLDGHLCNLPEGRILPDIQVEVKAADPPMQTYGDQHFPVGLTAIDSSVQAMKTRILTALMQFQLVDRDAYFSGNALYLDKRCTWRWVENRRNSLRGGKPVSVRGRAILNAHQGTPQRSHDHLPPQYHMPHRRENTEQIAGSNVGWFDQSPMFSGGSLPPGDSRHAQEYRPMYHNQSLPMPMQMPPRDTSPHWGGSPNAQINHNAILRSQSPRGLPNRRGHRGRGRPWRL